MAEGPITQRPDRLHTVEILRGLAALAVTWFHLTNGYDTGWAGKSGSLGWLGVDSFFVISGFVIPLSLQRAGYETRDFGRFMGRRLIRLEPPYLISIALVLMLQFASSLAPGFQGHDQGYQPAQIAAHLFYLIPLTPYHWLLPVYWTLAYEFVFYILTGLLFKTLWPRHISLQAAVVFGVFLLAHFITRQWDARILLFLFGIAGARYFTGRDSLTAFISTVAAVAIVLVATGAPLSGLVGLATILTIVFVRIPDSRALMWLGSISYSLYLIHVPIGGRVVNIGKRFIHGAPQQFALSLLALLVAVGCAWLFYRFIETSATSLSRRVPLKARRDDTGATSAP